MPISSGSAASAWVATTLRPIAPINIRIMASPLPPSLCGELFLKQDRIVLACKGAFCRYIGVKVAGHDHESAVRPRAVGHGGPRVGSGSRAAKTCGVRFRDDRHQPSWTVLWPAG